MVELVTDMYEPYLVPPNTRGQPLFMSLISPPPPVLSVCLAAAATDPSLTPSRALPVRPSVAHQVTEASTPLTSMAPAQATSATSEYVATHLTRLATRHPFVRSIVSVTIWPWVGTETCLVEGLGRPLVMRVQMKIHGRGLLGGGLLLSTDKSAVAAQVGSLFTRKRLRPTSRWTRLWLREPLWAAAAISPPFPPLFALTTALAPNTARTTPLLCGVRTPLKMMDTCQ